jgi:hypothetical protein
MTRINLREWIKTNRAGLDMCIRRVCPNLARLNDAERRLWILNDEGLYNWAKSEGVKV